MLHEIKKQTRTCALRSHLINFVVVATLCRFRSNQHQFIVAYKSHTHTPKDIPSILARGGKESGMGLHMQWLSGLEPHSVHLSKCWRLCRTGRKVKINKIWLSFEQLLLCPSGQWNIWFLGSAWPQIHSGLRHKDCWQNRWKEVSQLSVPIYKHCYPARKCCQRPRHITLQQETWRNIFAVICIFSVMTSST